MTASPEKALASQLDIFIDKNPAPEPVLRNMLETIIEQHTYLPDVFTIRLTDSNLELLDKGPFNLATSVTVKAENKKGESFILITGEITAIEPAFEEGGLAELVVRGYDSSHRLYRECKSRTFVNQKDSDIATTIAYEHDLRPDVKPTSTVYEHLFQHNQSDLDFLMMRAWRIGYECFVQGKTLYFRPPPQGEQGITLTWGDDLLSFHPRLTMAEQVREVSVRGWDVDRQRPLIGRAQSKNGKLYPTIDEKADKWLGKFGGGKLTITDQPVVSQAEADLLAKARLNERSGAFVQAEGSAFRRPDIKAGQIVNIAALGERLSGHYLVTSAQHVYTAEGLTTHFTVRGARTGSFAELVGGKRPLHHQTGITPAVVTNTDDPNDWGRVKVKFPWLTEEGESAWARVATVGAGPNAGFFGLPDVGDEVIVAFEQGDFNYPVVIGTVWNGQNPLPPSAAAAPAGQKPMVRTWTSREGHQITLFDTDKKIEIKSAGGLHITLDDNSKNITIEADNEIQIKARGNMALEAGGNMDIKASGNVTVKGATINLN